MGKLLAMEILNKYENELSTVQKTSMALTSPALSEVIAEIDKEAGRIATPGPEVNKEETKLVGGIDSRSSQFIQFTLETTFFALPLSNALEIGHRPEIAPLPNLPKWILGISNVRGEIISFVNLKAFLRIPSSGVRGERRFIIIYNHDMKVGISVDKTPGIFSMDKINYDIQSSPYRQGEFVKYINGVALAGESIINILDTDRLLSALRITDSEAG
jgi:purine-binding chemotaxis protein CheW